MYIPLEKGHYYHIFNRGNNRENLFIGTINYQFFLQKYAYYCYPVLDTYAYCLLKNHFHLLVRVREPAEMEEILSNEDIKDRVKKRLSEKEWSSKFVSQQISHLFNCYSQSFNKKYNRSGALFEGPFERLLIDEEKYFCNLLVYIHRNPQLHGFVSDYKKYAYSSFATYFSNGQSKINKNEALKRFGNLENFIAVHDEGMNIEEEFVLE